MTRLRQDSVWACFSNTEGAHTHFNEWLNKQLQAAGKKVDVHFQPVELAHLNDTEGIYEAATQSLNSVAASEGEKLVTLYLSPGTPVMAFVWAFCGPEVPNAKKTSYRIFSAGQTAGKNRPAERVAGMARKTGPDSQCGIGSV
ncbi:hypothetical protein LNP24_28090 [Klebsiella pneumoniae subsp. pneumoniae]|nr:hypothetical protein [Klebsiella pneumoniae subsp. pneumoniae]